MLINPVYIELRAEARFAKTKKGLSCIARKSDAGSFSGLCWQGLFYLMSIFHQRPYLR